MSENNVLPFRGRRPDAEAKPQPVVTRWVFQISAETVGQVPSDFRAELNQAVANAVSETLAMHGHMTVKGISDMRFDCRPTEDANLSPGFIIPLPRREDDED